MYRYHACMTVAHLPLVLLIAGIVLLGIGIARRSKDMRQLARAAFVFAAFSAIAGFSGAGAHGWLVARGALVGSGVTGVVASASIVLDGMNAKVREISICVLIAASTAALVLIANGY